MLKAVYFHAARTQLFLGGDGAEDELGTVGRSAGWTGGTVFYGQLFYGVPLTVANGVAKHATRSWFCGSTLVDFYITVSWMLLAHLPLVVGGEGHHPCFAMPCSSIRNIAGAVRRWYRRCSPACANKTVGNCLFYKVYNFAQV
uniref:(northern house mosquito) hypothetical protein n=1 Tax=Culex pipiens TaxID=7175 RepID=A0A8D8FVL4_CULPI